MSSGFGVARKIDAAESFRHILPNGESGVFAKLIDTDPAWVKRMDAINSHSPGAKLRALLLTAPEASNRARS